MDSPISERTPPSNKVRFASTPRTPRLPRTGPDVPDSVYRELLARSPNNPEGPMRDICAFIEVRVGTEDVSSTFESVMTRLGATVRRHLGPSVTHVVFREGRVSTRKRPLQLAIPLVLPLWVQESNTMVLSRCLANNRLASPERFPPYVSAAYDCPILSCKIRKPRSWQTKPDSPSRVRRRKRPRLLYLRSEVLLTEEVLSPNKQHLQDIVTKVEKHVLDLPRQRLLSGASSGLPMANPGGLMDTKELPTSLTELAQVEQQRPLPELPSKTDCRISRCSLEDFSTNVAPNPPRKPHAAAATKSKPRGCKKKQEMVPAVGTEVRRRSAGAGATPRFNKTAVRQVKNGETLAPSCKVPTQVQSTYDLHRRSLKNGINLEVAVTGSVAEAAAVQVAGKRSKSNDDPPVDGVNASQVNTAAPAAHGCSPRLPL